MVVFDSTFYVCHAMTCQVSSPLEFVFVSIIHSLCPVESLELDIFTTNGGFSI